MHTQGPDTQVNDLGDDLSTPSLRLPVSRAVSVLPAHGRVQMATLLQRNRKKASETPASSQVSKGRRPVCLSVKRAARRGLQEAPSHGSVVLPLWPCLPRTGLNSVATPPPKDPRHPPPSPLCSQEKSEDELLMGIVSDLLKRLPLTVEKEESSGAQSTLKGILSSPFWESLCKSVTGEHGPEAPHPPAPSAEDAALEAGSAEQDKGPHGSEEAESRWEAGSPSLPAGS